MAAAQARKAAQAAEAPEVALLVAAQRAEAKVVAVQPAAEAKAAVPRVAELREAAVPQAVAGCKAVEELPEPLADSHLPAVAVVNKEAEHPVAVGVAAVR